MSSTRPRISASDPHVDQAPQQPVTPHPRFLEQFGGDRHDITHLGDLEAHAKQLAEHFGASGHMFAQIALTTRLPGEPAQFASDVVSVSLSSDQWREFFDTQLSDVSTVAWSPLAALTPHRWDGDVKRWVRVEPTTWLPAGGGDATAQGATYAVFACIDRQRVGAMILSQATGIQSPLDLLVFHGLGLKMIANMMLLSQAERGKVLAEREREVLAWTAIGKTSFEIAIILGLSEHTVNHYCMSAAAKLGANNRAHAVAEALRQGLLQF